MIANIVHCSLLWQWESRTCMTEASIKGRDIAGCNHWVVHLISPTGVQILNWTKMKHGDIVISISTYNSVIYYTPPLFQKEQKAPRERKPQPRLVWGVKNIVVRHETFYAIVPCVMSNISWKFHENPSGRFCNVDNNTDPENITHPVSEGWVGDPGGGGGGGGG